MAELWGVWTTVRLAYHMGWGGVTLFLDNAGGIYQGVRGRASVGLWVQQWILRKVNLQLFRCPLVVHFVFVPTSLQPADPVSRSVRRRVGGAGHGHWRPPAVFGGGSETTFSMPYVLGLWPGMWVTRWGLWWRCRENLKEGVRRTWGFLGRCWCRDAWRGLVVLFDLWGPRESGCGCRSGPKTRAADVRQRGSIPVIVGIGGLIARGAEWEHHRVSARVERLCFFLCRPTAVSLAPSSPSTVGVALV